MYSCDAISTETLIFSATLAVKFFQVRSNVDNQRRVWIWIPCCWLSSAFPAFSHLVYLFYSATGLLSDEDHTKPCSSFVNSYGKWDFAQFMNLLPNQVVRLLIAMKPPWSDDSQNSSAWKLTSKSPLFMCKLPKMPLFMSPLFMCLEIVPLLLRCDCPYYSLLLALNSLCWREINGYWIIYLTVAEFLTPLGGLVFGITMDILWKTRNELIFGNIGHSVQAIVSKIMIILKDLEQVSVTVSSTLPVSRINKAIMLKWHPPPLSRIKVNSDGSFSPYRNTSAFGGVTDVLRDHEGRFLVGLLCEAGCLLSFHAELWGIVHGLKLALSKGFLNVIIESDSQLAVNLLDKIFRMTMKPRLQGSKLCC